MAENNRYIVTHILQTEKEDHYSIYDKQTKETTYDKYPRTMYQTEENILCYLDE